MLSSRCFLPAQALNESSLPLCFNVVLALGLHLLHFDAFVGKVYGDWLIPSVGKFWKRPHACHMSLFIHRLYVLLFCCHLRVIQQMELFLLVKGKKCTRASCTGVHWSRSYMAHLGSSVKQISTQKGDEEMGGPMKCVRVLHVGSVHLCSPSYKRNIKGRKVRVSLVNVWMLSAVEIKEFKKQNSDK